MSAAWSLANLPGGRVTTPSPIIMRKRSQVATPVLCGLGCRAQTVVVCTEVRSSIGIVLGFDCTYYSCKSHPLKIVPEFNRWGG